MTPKLLVRNIFKSQNIKITTEIKIAETELRCDLSKRFIKKGKSFKMVWLYPSGVSYVFRKRICYRKIKKYITKRIIVG